MVTVCLNVVLIVIIDCLLYFHKANNNSFTRLDFIVKYLSFIVTQ